MFLEISSPLVVQVPSSTAYAIYSEFIYSLYLRIYVWHKISKSVLQWTMSRRHTATNNIENDSSIDLLTNQVRQCITTHLCNSRLVISKYSLWKSADRSWQRQHVVCLCLPALPADCTVRAKLPVPLRQHLFYPSHTHTHTRTPLHFRCSTHTPAPVYVVPSKRTQLVTGPDNLIISSVGRSLSSLINTDTIYPPIGEFLLSNN